VIKLQRSAEDVADSLSGIEGHVGHLKYDLHPPQLFEGAIRDPARKCVRVELHLALDGRQEPGRHPRQRAFATARLADDAEHRPLLQIRLHVPQNRHCRLTVPDPSVSGGQVSHGHHRALPGCGFSTALMVAADARRRADRGHELARVLTAWIGDHLSRIAQLDDVAAAQHQDAIGDLRDHREIVGHVDTGGALIANDLLEGTQHLDLGGDVQRRGRFVQHHEVGSAAQRHRSHQSLQLPAAHLVRIAPAEQLGFGEIQTPKQIHGAGIGGLLVHDAVKDRGLGDLLTDGQRRIEGGGGALGEIRDSAAAKLSQSFAVESEHVGVFQEDAAVGDAATRARVSQCRECDGGLSRARLADQRQHLSRRDGEAHVPDNGRKTPGAHLGFHP
jgi:hypothetical protein